VRDSRALDRLLRQIDATGSAHEVWRQFSHIIDGAVRQWHVRLLRQWFDSLLLLASVKTAAILSTNCNRWKLDRQGSSTVSV